ncbi:hypothetical protein [Castellaniella daejeonensis]
MFRSLKMMQMMRTIARIGPRPAPGASFSRIPHGFATPWLA